VARTSAAKRARRRTAARPKTASASQVGASTARPILRALDALAEGVIFRNHEGAVVDCNLAAQRILGLSVDQIAQRIPLEPGWQIVREDGTLLASGIYPFREMLWTDQPQRDVVLGIHRPDGTTTWIALNTVAFRAADDLPPGVLCTFRDITERKKAEAREHEARVRVELAARSGDVGFWDWDIATNTVVFSDEWKSQLGYAPHEVSSNYFEWETRLHPDDRSRAIGRVQSYLTGTAREYALEFRLRHKDGSYRWIFSRGEALRDSGGNPRRLVGCHIDVTERKLAERAVLESRQRYANLVQSIEGVVWEADARTFEFTYVSDHAESLLGYPLHAWLGSETFWQDHLHPDDRDLAVLHRRDLMAKREGHEHEYRMIAFDGRVVWIRDMVTVVAEDGDARVLRGLMLDVTARREAQEALIRKKEELILAMELASLGHWEFDATTRHLVFDDAFLRLLRTTADEQGGTSMPVEEYVRRFLPEDATEVMTDALNDALAAPGREHTRQVEHRWRRADGTIAVVTVRFVLVKNDAGELLKCYGVTQDITERKKVETRFERLLEGESILSSVSQRFIEMDLAEFDDEVRHALETISRFAGAVRAALFRYSADGARVLTPCEWYLKPGDSVLDDVKGLRTGHYAYFHQELRAFRPIVVRRLEDVPEGSAERIWAEEHGFRPTILMPLTSHTRLIGVLGFYGRYDERDAFPQDMIPLLGSFAVSLSHAIARKAAEEERVFLERQLFQSQKLEAIGTLAGGIAHDFNNILTAIVGNLELARMDTEAGRPIDDSMTAIETAADRATALVQQILAFSRHHTHERRVVALPAVVADAVRFVRATIPAVIGIDLSIGPGVPHVLADPTQIHQILINLCANAWHAMEATPGRIGIAVDAVVLGDREAARIGGISGGECARVSVTDTGGGMDDATLKRIFEPFFTTKPVGKGTGLGMSVVLGIVQTHQGGITVESAVGAGTIVRVYIPAARSDIGVVEPSPATALGNGERLLLLDDEVELARVMSRALERLGYQVHSFSDPRGALTAFDRRPDTFDLVIADYEMPEVTGLDVARTMLRIRPDLPIVLWSGRFAADIDRVAAAIGIRRLVTKPCEPRELSRIISEILQVPRAG
jgi:PAS domain S-box-containing protein